MQHESLSPGDYICYSHQFSTYFGSAGFYGYILDGSTKRWGFFTAAHTLTANPDAVIKDIAGIPMGKAIRYELSSTVDAAFVEMTGYGSSFSNKVDGYYLQGGVTVIPAQGSTIYMMGHVSGKSPGTVLSTMGQAPDGAGGYYTGLLEADYSSANGDSGGLVYTRSGSIAKVCGLHKGSYQGHAFATKAAYIPWGAQPS